MYNLSTAELEVIFGGIQCMKTCNGTNTADDSTWTNSCFGAECNAPYECDGDCKQGECWTGCHEVKKNYEKEL